MIIVGAGEAGLRTALGEILARCAAGQRCVIRAGDLVTADLATAPVLDDGAAQTAILVRPAAHGGDVRVRHHMVVAVATDAHHLNQAGHRMVGAMSIDARHAEQAEAALRELLAALDESVFTPGDDAFAWIALAVVRSGVPTRAITMVDIPWCRGEAQRTQTQQQLATITDEQIQRLQANRLDDGFYSTFVVRKVAKPFTRAALRLGLSPNAITMISFVIGIGAALMFAQGSWWWLLAGALALQLSLVIDCVDGEVARSTRNFTPLGAWLDASTDRVKEMLVYAGLAYAADAWAIGVALILVQTVRHMSDYNFAAVQRRREAVVIARSVREVEDDDPEASWSAVSARMNQRPVVHWAKKVIHLPIGERWLLISVVAVVAGPWWALAILLAAGLLALGYVTVGRVVRTLGWRGSSTEDVVQLLRRQFDAGPLLGWSAPLVPWRGRWGWALPALLRCIELGVLVAIAWWWQPTAVIVVFWWMAVVAFHDYDLLYRALQGASMPRTITWLALGWDGRTALVLVALAIGVLATVLGVGVIWLAIIVVLAASVQWLQTMARRT